jgi:hypothetical protein
MTMTLKRSRPLSSEPNPRYLMYFMSLSHTFPRLLLLIDRRKRATSPPLALASTPDDTGLRINHTLRAFRRLHDLRILFH